ncbi:HSP20-like chaperone, partial [Neoconidiobolus thromboides FSU 785]
LNPKVEVIRKDQQTIVQAELAGFNKEDIQINVSEDQRQLVLSGESKRDKTHNEGEISYSEREYGSFTRSFTLPPGSKTEDIKAKFDNGLLEVIIPK